MIKLESKCKKMYTGIKIMKNKQNILYAVLSISFINVCVLSFFIFLGLYYVESYLEIEKVLLMFIVLIFVDIVVFNCINKGGNTLMKDIKWIEKVYPKTEDSLLV